jgi:hypothetical protein
MVICNLSFVSSPCFDPVSFAIHHLNKKLHVAEHQVELQTIPMWYTAAIQGTLPFDGPASAAPLNPAGRVDPNFFMTTLTSQYATFPLNPPAPAAAGGAILPTIEDRLFNALGSTLNDEVFVLADEGLNCIKEAVRSTSSLYLYLIYLIPRDILVLLTGIYY